MELDPTRAGRGLPDARPSTPRPAATGPAAVRDRFRALVRELEVQTILDVRPARTAWEAAYRASRALPGCTEALRAGAESFNAVVYGDRPADAGDVPADGGARRQVTAAAGAGRPGRRRARWRPDERGPARRRRRSGWVAGIVAGALALVVLAPGGDGRPRPTGSRPTTRGPPRRPERARSAQLLAAEGVDDHADRPGGRRGRGQGADRALVVANADRLTEADGAAAADRRLRPGHPAPAQLRALRAFGVRADSRRSRATRSCRRAARSRRPTQAGSIVLDDAAGRLSPPTGPAEFACYPLGGSRSRLSAGRHRGGDDRGAGRRRDRQRGPGPDGQRGVRR